MLKTHFRKGWFISVILLQVHHAHGFYFLSEIIWKGKKLYISTVLHSGQRKEKGLLFWLHSQIWILEIWSVRIDINRKITAFSKKIFLLVTVEKRPGVTNNINNVYILFRCPSKPWQCGRQLFLHLFFFPCQNVFHEKGSHYILFSVFHRVWHKYQKQILNYRIIFK